MTRRLQGILIVGGFVRKLREGERLISGEEMPTAQGAAQWHTSTVGNALSSPALDAESQKAGKVAA